MTGHPLGLPGRGRFGISRTAVMNNLARLGAESRRGVVDRHIEEACALYKEGWSLAQVGVVWGVDPATVRLALMQAGGRLRARPGC